MNVFSSLARVARGRPAWALLLFFALAFQVVALYFQHTMNLLPCVMCIYERVAMFGIAGAALIGLFAPNNAFFRWGGIICWGVAAVWGVKLAHQHIEYQFPDPNVLFGPTCELFVSFPSWAPLNEWLPSVFQSYGDCSMVVWEFLGYSMPQWLLVIFVMMLAAQVCVLVSELKVLITTLRGEPTATDLNR
ncbi:disulfide bond formation protein DsbB [Veronia pacifica]|uniref:Disulfide bond formation protein B n=1 Tax=Veronia pacifica TaxID=1080227 RepID=A0A1C3EJW0_9GAMM|nr:disulfide bond formation protein DsbB [Veronia pacifica]ODA33519.1 disulfide bond formation protein B [Veronia pacifica]